MRRRSARRPSEAGASSARRFRTRARMSAAVSSRRGRSPSPASSTTPRFAGTAASCSSDTGGRTSKAPSNWSLGPGKTEARVMTRMTKLEGQINISMTVLSSSAPHPSRNGGRLRPAPHPKRRDGHRTPQAAAMAAPADNPVGLHPRRAEHSRPLKKSFWLRTGLWPARRPRATSSKRADSPAVSFLGARPNASFSPTEHFFNGLIGLATARGTRFVIRTSSWIRHSNLPAGRQVSSLVIPRRAVAPRAAVTATCR